MALREFRDRSGREWRVWDVTAEKLHPRTRAEDWMREYLDGWLAFESVDGEAKCRLHPVPANWDKADVAQLVEWLHQAEPVRGDRTSGPYGRTLAEEEAREAEWGPLATPPRIFRFPGGRLWTVGVWTTHIAGQAGAVQSSSVLRFSSGARSLDLLNWPHDWQQYSDDALARLLSQSFPRPASQPNPTEFRRRATDVERG